MKHSLAISSCMASCNEKQHFMCSLATLIVRLFIYFFTFLPYRKYFHNKCVVLPSQCQGWESSWNLSFKMLTWNATLCQGDTFLTMHQVFQLPNLPGQLDNWREYLWNSITLLASTNYSCWVLSLESTVEYLNLSSFFAALRILLS